VRQHALILTKKYLQAAWPPL